MTDSQDGKILRAAELLQKGGVLAITGAGISTASGIGDYRDADGQWKRGEPIQHQDFVRTHAMRQRYWARSQKGFPEFSRAAPNSAHAILAGWEEQGQLVGLITQNVDRLHQAAGHRQVIDLHGRLDQVVCLACSQLSSRKDLQAWLEDKNPDVQEDFYTLRADGDAELERQDFSAVQVPECSCGGTLKPNVVFFGDAVSKLVVSRAYDWVEQATSLVVVGSSLMVFSSFRFVRKAHQLGLPILIINQGVTRADELATLKLEGDCGALLELVTRKAGLTI